MGLAYRERVGMELVCRERVERGLRNRARDTSGAGEERDRKMKGMVN
jgi:hypothetical protein